MPASYDRFFFMSHGRTIATEVLECYDDTAALEKVKQLISNSNFNAMEIWQEDRRVGNIERART